LLAYSETGGLARDMDKLIRHFHTLVVVYVGLFCRLLIN